jgi:alpha-1,2-mannosyltransferase
MTSSRAAVSRGAIFLHRSYPTVLLLAALALALIGSQRLAAALDMNARNNYVDFGVFYRAATCIVSGCNPYEISPGQLAPNLAPPHALVLFVPLQFWTIGSAYLAWLILNVVVLGVCVWLIARELQIRGSWTSWVVVAAGVASSGLMMGTVTSGNYYLVLAGPMTLAWIAWRHGRVGFAGLWLGLAAACKVLLLLPLLWFVLHREYRAATIMIAAWLAVFLAGLLALGADTYAGWLSILARAPMDGQFHDAALLQFAQRALSETPQFVPLLSAPAMARPLWAVLAGLAVTMTVVVKRDPDRTMLSVVAAAILVAPIGWVFGSWWLAGPAAAAWLSGTPATRRLLVLAGVGLWLPDTTPLWGQPSPWLTVTLGSLNTWVILALLCAGLPARRDSFGTRSPVAAHLAG